MLTLEGGAGSDAGAAMGRPWSAKRSTVGSGDVRWSRSGLGASLHVFVTELDAETMRTVGETGGLPEAPPPLAV